MTFRLPEPAPVPVARENRHGATETAPADALSFAARRTDLVGREPEIADVLRAVDAANHSVITITGVGGSGKTSLAVEVAHRLIGQFGRRWLVDLAAVDHPDDVVVHVLHTIGLRSTLGDPHDVLTAELRRGPALLVLDNCEHVLDAAAHLVGVAAAACPELTIVATSRRPLDVPGERRLSLGPLPLTDGAAPGPAVRLLAARANALGARLDADGPEGARLLSVCRRLDGLPLPLVLVATRLRGMTPAELDDLLADGLALPAMRGGTAHQRTMTASLDWSLALLSDAAVDLYRRLGAFVGTFDAALAAAVEPPATPPARVAATLAELVDHSLLLVDTTGTTTRYRMLAVVREHARAGLDDDARARTAGAHRRAVLERVTAHRERARYFSPEQIAGFLEVLHDDVVAAIDSAIAARDAAVLVGLLTSTIRFWRVTGRIRFGLDRTIAALAVLEEADRAVLEYMRADQERVLGLLDEAAEHALDSLRRIREDGPSAWLPFALGGAGDVAASQGRFDDARAAYQEIRELYDPESDPQLHGLWCANLGGIELAAGRDDAAAPLLEEALAVFAVHPPVWLVGRVRGHLGVVARRRGDFPAAAALLLEGLDRLAPYNALAEAAPLVDELARVLAATGRGQDAEDCRHAAAAMRRRMGSPDLTDADGPDGEPSMSIAEVVVLGRRSARPRHSEVLTPRELEVAGLVAEGLTNPQIAERLVISPGTARTHVERIRTKLGVGSRVQVARWVLGEYVDRQTR